MCETETVSPSLVFSLLKKRAPDSHKGCYGTLTVLAGSSLYRGAAALCVKGALRCGTGIVRLASVEPVVTAVASKVDACIFRPLPMGEDGSVDRDALPLILSDAKKSTAFLAGCGLTQSDSVRYLIPALIESVSCPLLLDADALNVLSSSPSLLQKAQKTPVITPHVGEMSRLCGLPIDEILRDPDRICLRFAEDCGCVTVLKGAVTRIASPDGRLSLHDRPNSGLAKGGSGDCLAGILAGLLAQGLGPFDAARCAVWLHGEAAARCAAVWSQTAMLPDDLPSFLGEIFRERQL